MYERGDTEITLLLHGSTCISLELFQYQTRISLSNTGIRRGRKTHFSSLAFVTGELVENSHIFGK